MPNPLFAPRRGTTIALLVTTIAWAVPNAISLVDLATRSVDGHEAARVAWMIASLLAIMSVCAAASAFRRSRLGILVMIPVLLAPAIDTLTTIVSSDDPPATWAQSGHLLHETYITALSGEYGWRGINAALAMWLFVPVFIGLLAWGVSQPPAAERMPPPVPPPAPLPDAWHVLVHGVSYGPYRWHELLAYASDGRVTPYSMIRRPDGAVVPLGQLLAPQR